MENKKTFSFGYDYVKNHVSFVRFGANNTNGSKVNK